MREPRTSFSALLDRYLANDALTRETLADLLLAEDKGDEERTMDRRLAVVREVVLGSDAAQRLPTLEECKLLATHLHCLPEELYVDEESVRVWSQGDCWGSPRIEKTKHKPNTTTMQEPHDLYARVWLRERGVGFGLICGLGLVLGCYHDVCSNIGELHSYRGLG